MSLLSPPWLAFSMVSSVVNAVFSATSFGRQVWFMGGPFNTARHLKTKRLSF
jgi:ABC-type xylose transport system permease subunit